MRLKKEPEILIKTISEMLHSYGVEVLDASEGIEYLLDNPKVWQVRDPAPGLLEKKEFKFFPEFCEFTTPWGLRTSYATVIDICKRDDRVYHKVVEAGKQRGFKGNQHTKNSLVYNVNEAASVKGNSKAYGLSRLSKYRPDLYEAVLDKEMSVNEAMIEAGLRVKTYTVKQDVDAVVKLIKKVFDKGQIQHIKDSL